MGDLNHRTALASDYIIDDFIDDFIAPENDNNLYILVCDKELKRYSEDYVKNNHS